MSCSESELESVRRRLKEESNKYGAKNSVFRKGFKKLLSRPDPAGCSVVLNGCRNDLHRNSATLDVSGRTSFEYVPPSSYIHSQSVLSNPETANDKPSSQAVDDQTRINSGLSGTPTPPGAASLGQNTALTPGKNLVQSNTPQFEASQVSSAMAGKGKGSSRRGDLLDGANKAFKIAEGLSGALPVVGSYVGAVAKVGLTVIEMVQVSGSAI